MLVVGAGAAGLFAALAATKRNLKPVLIEAMPGSGRKLALTGGGRCNISNQGDLLMGLHNTKFLRPALSALDHSALRAELAELGISVRTEAGGKAYPDPGGREFVAIITEYLRSRGAQFWYGRKLTQVITLAGRVSQAIVDNESIPCTSMILAPGGCSWPQTGSDGSSWPLLSGLGHNLTPPLPALVALATREQWPASVSGLSVQNVELSVLVADKTVDTARGDLLFTHFGLSGPVVLDTSWAAAQGLNQNKKVQVSIDLVPDLSLALIGAHFNENRAKTVANALAGLLPKQLAQHLGSQAPVRGLARNTLENLATSLKNCRLEISRTLGLNQAMVTQGGVSLRQVNPRTMESKVVSGLYLAGEVLDYHGRSGGYNLHAAFASGWLAGNSTPIIAD